MDVKYRKDENRSFQEENKRIKLISPVAELIDKIEETQQWPWINEMCTLIDLYPNVLNENCFIQLLQILSKLQVDCKDNTVAHHIYCCLCLLKDIQPSLQLDNKAEVKNTWIVIRDTTLRSFGLNQNDPKLHFLLQKLIHTDNIIPEPLLRTYTSEVLDVTESNLKTLNSTFSCLNCTQNENQSHTLIKWILSKNSSDNYNYFTKCITAKILVSLIVKRWPIFDEVADVGSSIIEKERLFDDIGDIYLKTAFENSMIPESQKENCSIKNNEPKKRKIILNDSANTVLMSSLQNLLDNMQGLKNESKKILFFINVLALIKNVISYSLNFEILSEDEMNENILFNMITPIFNNVNTILTNCFKLKHLDDLKIASLNDCVVCFYEMMSTFLNPFFDRKFRKIIPTDLLKTLISFLHTETRENKIDFKDLRLPLQNFRIMVIKSLVYYSCGMRTFSSPTEKFMFNALAEFDYNIHEHSSCDLTMAFLRSIRECKLDMLDVSSIKLILALLRKLCEARYEYYSSATEILQFIHDIGPVVECGGSDESKSLFSNLLYPFYKERNNYGPGFSVILVNCIGKFHQMDPDCAFTKWEGSEVALKLPEFLCSAYQEVRFAASQNLIQLFKSSPSRKNLRDYHLQEIIFEDICNKCEKIFEVEGSLTRERKVDEAVTRSAVVLQLLSSITIVSDRWREESLFALLKVVHKRRLEPFAKVLNMVSTRLSLENEIVFLEKYFTVLLRRWIHDGLSFMPFLIVFDKESLDVISECTAKSIAIILQASISIICVDSMVSDITNISQDVFERNELIRYVLQHIQKEELLTLFTEKIDEILLYLISMVRDEQDLSDNFQVSVMFAKSYIKTITIANFKSVLNFIKEILGFEKPLITILFTQQVHKLQQVMMQLIIKINNSIAAEDKLQIFHHYIIMNDLIIENFDLSDARDYFIRDFCYVFMRFIRNHEKCPELSKFVLIYFRKSLVRLFDYSEILCKHFASIATTLVDIVMERKIEEISELSLNLLKFLIIDNTQHFEEVIKHMDNIPDSPFLTELIRIQSDLKYDGKETHLKEEIQNFINFVNISRNYSSRIDSLRRLKMHLFCEKRQLKKLYEQLSNLKGFSEDCENSCLHQLISILVDLSQSKDKDISMEALKCLGELGPSDLMTLVVKPEKHLTYMNSTPFEFFTGQVISLLNIYLIDDDIRLLQPSAAILYRALNSKEGRKVLQSNEDYGCGSIASQYLFPFMVIEKPKSVSFKIGIEQLIRKINLDELWHPNTSIHYDNWLKDLVCNILETVADSYVPQLIHVCHLKVELCEVLLPSLIYLLISLNNNKINKIIATQLNKFLMNTGLLH
ncbi:hypothetical protein HHI36_012745 [Cryptolaemus montrouzieri]|uniref:HEAT repeat-containing protein 1 n=1 Tax=Cryptolaemus montrouzieri TaxID=559131 RepID=A0ABD2NF95_9CUCU